MKKRYIGIDPSLSATGLVMINDKEEIIEERLIKTWPKSANVYLNSEQRILDIFNQIAFLDGVPNLISVCIEDIGYMSKDSSLFERVGLIFLIRTFMFNNNIPFEVIAPKSLKKQITGNGNADKKMMMDFCKEKWGYEFKDDNICDAFGLAIIALRNDN